MRTVRGRAWIRRGGIPLAVLAAAVTVSAGCQDSHRLTGSYRSIAPVVVDQVPGLSDGAYVELILGQFGPDVAGIVRFFADPEFILPVEGVCPCRFLNDGRYGDGRLVFRFRAPYPCGGDDAEELAAWLATSDGGDTLEGPIGRAREGTSWTFRRNLEAQDLGTQDKTCDESPAGSHADDIPGGGDAIDAEGG